MILAERTMELPGESKQIRITIGLPIYIEPTNYQCSIDFFEAGALVHAMTVDGGDAIQAVLIAMDAIRSVLLDRWPTAQWMGLPVELSFPRPIPYMAGMDVYNEVRKFSDDLLEKRFG